MKRKQTNRHQPKQRNSRLFLICVLLLIGIIGCLSLLGRENATKEISFPTTVENGALKLIGQQPVSIEMPVKARSQFPTLPTGCEIADVAMLFDYRGHPTDLATLANSLPYTDNPETGFWGDPFTGTGYTMYPPGWRPIFEKKLGSFTDLSGQSVTKLKGQLAKGKPIVAWVHMHGFFAHAILLTGYDHDTIIYNDPFTGKGRQQMSSQRFWTVAASQKHRAMTY
ncbi:C39 family peptidase [Loigolactobacillus backii]|nr:C39 family peptidase [Loigolactobacillus backii]